MCPVVCKSRLNRIGRSRSCRVARSLDRFRSDRQKSVQLERALKCSRMRARSLRTRRCAWRRSTNGAVRRQFSLFVSHNSKFQRGDRKRSFGKMECLIGIQFKDFVLVAADMTAAQSIMVMKNDEQKIHKISDKLVVAVCGESGDTTQFSELIGKNIQLYKMRNGYELSPKAAASFTRRTLADSLRSRTPYLVNMLMAGYDNNTGPELYFIDYLASCVKVPYASHGYGGFFSLSILDRYHKYDSSQEEAYLLMKKCVVEIHKRLIVNLPNFKVQKVSKDGIEDLEPITAKNLALEDRVQ